MAVHDLLETVPGFIWAVIGLVIAWKPGVILISEGLLWAGQFRARRLVERAAKSPIHMEVDIAAAKRAVFPARLTLFDALENITRAVVYRVNGVQYLAEERTRVESQGEAQFWQAFYEAGRARGLRYLPARVAPHIQLHLAEALLRSAGAEADAMQYLEERRQRLARNTLCDSLFSTETLNKVDLTPNQGSGDHYFAKYFQPLMMAFASRRFRESCPSLEEEHKVLLQHLQLLSTKRLRAAHCVQPMLHEIERQLVAALPQAVPRGIGKSIQRQEVDRINRKESLQGVLLLGHQSEEAAMEQLLFHIDQHLQRVRANFDKRTADYNSASQGMYALYHASAR